MAKMVVYYIPALEIFNVKEIPNSCLEDLRKTMKSSVRLAAFWF
jgi:hypothetical protein